MKQQFLNFMIAGLFGLLSFAANGQEETQRQPAWVSDHGYWIVESNIHAPKQHTIRFYNNQHIQIGRKDITGIRLNFRKRKVKMMLKDALETSLVAWEKARRDSIEQPLAKQNHD